VIKAIALLKEVPLLIILNQKNKEGKLQTKIIKTSGNIYQQAMVMKI
jgi:hypothetical protein